MFPQLLETLLTARARTKKTDDEIAYAIGMSRATLTRRLREPGSFRLDELEALRRELNIPMSKMVWR